MKFTTVFNRWKGAGQPTNVPILIGSDSVPSTPPKATMDNLLSSRFISINGWPSYRVAVAYKPPSGAASLKGNMYMYEDTIGAWFRINASADVLLVANAVTFFDCVALLDLPNVAADLAGGPGSIGQLLVVSDNGGADGLHQFAMAADLTSYN